MIFGKEKYYYHQTIRNYTAIFGYLFSDLYVKTGDLFKKVTVKQVGGNLYETVAQNEENRDKKNVSMILPSIAYDLESFVRSNERKLNRNNNVANSRIQNITSPSVNMQLNRMPYDFNFSVSIRTKTQDEMLQIVEQVIGAFNPDITFKIKDNNDLELDQDIVIIMNEDIQKNDNYDEYNSIQHKEWIISFTLKGYMYRRTVDTSVITSITLSGILGNSVGNDITWELNTTETPTISPPAPITPKTTKRKGQNKI